MVHFEQQEEEKIQPKQKVPLEIESQELPALEMEKNESTISFDAYMEQSELSLDIIALIASNMTDFECMMKLSLASKEFHMAV